MLIAQKSKVDHQIQKSILRLVEDKEFSTASFSISIVDLKNGHLIGSYDPNRALIPASVQKIFTTAATLYQLGGNYTYKTDFYLNGFMENDSTFVGILGIRSSGDPSFCSTFQKNTPLFESVLDTVYNILISKNIKKFKGDVHVDRNFITDQAENAEWLYYDLGNYYGAGCHSLNFLENTSWISIQPQSKKDSICKIIKVSPYPLQSNFISAVRSVEYDVDEDLYFLGNSNQKQYIACGELKINGPETITLKGSIPDPADVFEILLKDGLYNKGIRFEWVPRSLDSLSSVSIYNHVSPDLMALCDRGLKKSVNLYSESFLHIYGNAINGNTKRKEALSALQSFWAPKFKSVQGFYLIDGSGLSPKNRLTSAHVTDALYWISKQESLRNYETLLQDAASEGSLSGALSKYKSTKNRFRLKSGSMQHVRSYAGYLMENEKPVWAISIIINHSDGSSTYIQQKVAKWFSELGSIKN
jgi:serine-type D-Ala-D-Ala carboxypeptidase/endopeptidase (penicillin-binding protein 4)